MTKKIAVIVSGCGHLDGAEIRESVLTLLYLDQAGAEVSLFAPDMPQHHVINHLTGEEMVESRNVLVEAARIARGSIRPLSEAKAVDFDGIILPGGYGAAKNLSNLAFKGADATMLPALQTLLLDFARQGKPIGAICIAPAVLAIALGKTAAPTLTIGEDAGTAEVITALGGTHRNCPTDAIVIDEENHLVSCSAYMRNDRLASVASGIEKLVAQLLTWCQPGGKASNAA